MSDDRLIVALDGLLGSCVLLRMHFATGVDRRLINPNIQLSPTDAQRALRNACQLHYQFVKCKNKNGERLQFGQVVNYPWFSLECYLRSMVIIYNVPSFFHVGLATAYWLLSCAHAVQNKTNAETNFSLHFS